MWQETGLNYHEITSDPSQIDTNTKNGATVTRLSASGALINLKNSPYPGCVKPYIQT